MARPYKTDISDAQWELIQEILETGTQRKHNQGRKRQVDLRAVWNGIRYQQRSSCAWELLPHQYAPHQTVYAYFRRWQHNGTLERIHQQLRTTLRLQAGREAQARVGCLDSQSVKTTDVGGESRGFDGGKKINGRKRHILVDTLGLLIAVVVSAANQADSKVGGRLLTLGKLGSDCRLEHCWVDQGYRGERLQGVGQA
jgi:putative transposase